MKVTKLLVVVLAALPLCGCASSEVLPASGVHAPTSPQKVKLYQEQPRRYEDLGLISVPITPEMKWDDRGDAKLAFDAMRAKAAALGANGLLLTVDPSKYDALTTAGFEGAYYQVPVRSNPKTAIGQAVFVLEE